MATEVATSQSSSTLPLYRMDVGMYHRLVEAGALKGVDVELLDGLLVDKHSHREDDLHRLDVGTYNRMVATGALEGLPVELLEGLLVEVMSPQSAEHASVIERLTPYLGGAQARLRVQLPLEIGPHSEPEPDLALIEGEPSSKHHPRTALLAIEVAVTSHKQDRGEKADLYAGAPIPTYWLVDVPGRAIEVRSGPGPEGYRRCEIYGVGATVRSPVEGVPDLDVGELFDGLGD
jgi:Uma2 family endonuclease